MGTFRTFLVPQCVVCTYKSGRTSSCLFCLYSVIELSIEVLGVTLPIHFTLMTYGGWDWQFIEEHFSHSSYQRHYSASSYVAAVRVTKSFMHHPRKLSDSIESTQNRAYFGRIYVMNNKCQLFFKCSNLDLHFVSFVEKGE